MKRIGDVSGDRWANGSTGLAGREMPEMVDGMPADRTICPACLGTDGAACPICRGYPVCPDCRGAGYLRDAGARTVRYHVCPSCGDHDERDTSRYGLPARFARTNRKRLAVAAYQAARADAARARAGRPLDPWEVER